MIASGGETSRIMLALKKIFQINDPVDTLILDEIDSGISGETAEKVAEQLVQISKMKASYMHNTSIPNNEKRQINIFM